jgi:hypothetical protein
MVRLDRPATFDTGASFPALKNLKSLSSVAGSTPPPSPEAQVAHLLRTRMDEALRAVTPALKNAERATEFLTQAQRKVLEASPEQQRPLLAQRFNQENRARLVGMRIMAAGVEQPYSPQERSANIQQTSGALRSQMEQQFATLERYANRTDPLDRDLIVNMVARTREIVLRDIDTHMARMASDKSLPSDRASAYRSLLGTFRGVRDMYQRVIAGLPPGDQQLAVARLGLQQEKMKMLNTTLIGRAMTPRSPTDLSTLWMRLPPLTGPLNAEQAMKTMGQLESAIRTHKLERMSHLKDLSPEHMEIARFEIEAENARLLATAYRNVLGRLEGTQTPPPAPKA